MFVSLENSKNIEEERNELNCSINEPLRGFPEGLCDIVKQEKGLNILTNNCTELIFTGNES